MRDRSPVVAVVSTARPADSHRFHEDVLGLRCRANEPASLVFEGDIATIGVAKTPGVEPSERTVLGWEVSEIGAAVTGLVDAGCRVPPLRRSRAGRAGDRDVR